MPLPVSEYVPQFVSPAEDARARGRAVWGWALTASVTLGLLGLTVLAPWARAHGHASLSAAAYGGFSAACHQMPERSFHFEGFPLAVCARCFGLYVGGALGVLAYPLVRSLTRVVMPWRGWLLLAALPTTVDFALGFFGVWENTHLSRFLTASLLGAAAAFYILPGLLDLSLNTRAGFRFGRPHES